MKIQPFHDNVLVRPDNPEEVTKGGIYLPDIARAEPLRGTVVAVGPGAKKEDGTRIPMEVKEGDRILYGRYSGAEVEIEGEKLLLMKERDIYGLILG